MGGHLEFAGNLTERTGNVGGYLMTTGEPDPAGPIETKVKAATTASAVASLIVAWLVTSVPALADTPAELRALLVAAITSGITWLAGYLARHTYRPLV